MATVSDVASRGPSPLPPSHLPSDEREGMLARLGLRFTTWAEHWFPDAYVFVCLAVAVVAHVVLTRLRIGWRILAVGGSRRAAYNAGIPAIARPTPASPPSSATRKLSVRIWRIIRPRHRPSRRSQPRRSQPC